MKSPIDYILDPLRPRTPMEQALATLPPSPPVDPRNDERLIQLRQMLSLSRDAFDAASVAAYQASQAKFRAEMMLREIQVRIELIEEELGIEPEEDEHARLETSA